MSLGEFQIIAKLGDGSYSQVYKVVRVEDGQEYALKKVKMINLSDREKENALNEVRILASIKHKNVAAYKQAFFDEPSSSLCFSIVMEYADNGDVFQKICEYQQQGTTMKEKIIWKIFIQAVRGLKALHDLKILHRDMKSANIFLWKDYTAKLGDLNVSKVAKKGLLYTQTGTPYYASPEVWKDQPYDGKSDIWSLGCVLYEMCSLVPPFRADDMNGLFKKILKGQYPPIPSHYSMELRSVIKSLVQVNAASRPTCDQILEMGIVSKRAKKYFNEGQPIRDIESESELLKTIKFSKNLFKLKLPQATYEQLSFATIPIHSNKQRQLEQKRHQLSSKTQIVDKPILPRITQSTRGGGANNSNINNSTHSGDGDDEYEQDFEIDERRNASLDAKPKSRSYSGRKEIEARKYHSQKKHSQQQQLQIQQLQVQQQQNTDNQASHDSLQLVSSRSKQNLQGQNNQQQQNTSEEQTQSLPNLPQAQRNVMSPKNNEKRGLSSSPSHQILQTVDSQQSTQMTPNQQQTISGQTSTIAKPKKVINKQQLQDHSQIASTIFEQEDESEAVDKLSRSDNKRMIKINRVVNNASSNAASDMLSKDQLERVKIRENASSVMDPMVQRSRDDRKAHHLPTQKLEELPRVAQLSQSPSHLSLGAPEGSPLIHAHNQQTKSLNPHSGAKGSIVLKQINPQKQSSQLLGQSNNNPSPNFKRIVNIYSMNSQKKKKYMLNYNNSIGSYGGASGGGNSSIAINSTNASSLQGQNIGQVGVGHERGHNVSHIYKGEDIKQKLQQLREGMGYYESKSLNHSSIGGAVAHNNNREMSQDQVSQHSQGHNNSVLLPELKSITPHIQNVKNNYHVMTNGSNSYSNNNSVAKLINRKKSYERLIRGGIDHSNINLYKHPNGKIEINGNIRSGGIHQYTIKQRPNVQQYYNNLSNINGSNSLPHHYQLNANGSSMLSNELDVQGRSVINQKQISHAGGNGGAGSNYLSNNL